MIDGEQVRQGRSLDLSAVPTQTLREKLRDARKKLDKQGGRGVDLAELIDCARFELRSRAARKAAKTRASR